MDERTVEIDSKALGTDLASKIATEAFKHVPKYSWGGHTASHIHGVIQLAALNALTASGLTSKLAALEDENKTLREAVEFYADRQHWRTANSSGAAMNNRGLGLGFHQTGEGQMEVLAANCGQFVVFDNWVHGGHWQADAGHIDRAALSNQPTLSKDNDHA